MRGRILGYMMREAPTSYGCDNVQKEIESCETDEALRALAQVYAAYLFRLFRKAKGRIGGSSSHSSRPSVDDTQQTIVSLLEEAPKSNFAVKQLALTRDDYRCVVTGAYDLDTYRERLRTDPTFEEPKTIQVTRAAHIFPDSLNQDFAWPDGVLGKKADYSATAWPVVERFGQVNVITESLNGPDIHRVENVLTMSLTTHELFDRLELWFEATIHAACVKVAHLSGAARYLEIILKEWEERPVLGSDGGSADMLSFLLARAVIATY
ncbi:hypothetical protein FRC04_010606 [Tulasnella sp. 424]|nr:hypothetical protein FRC04_010606 [Tulasnella sp. 424]